MALRLRVAHLDGEVHYADFGGRGPPLVLVHGLGGAHLNWAALAPLLRRHGRVLAVDLPGFGLSPPPPGGASLRALELRLSRFLGEVAGGRATLVGHSMGGLLSVLVAAQMPNLIDRLVLIGPAQPLPDRRSVDPVTAATFFAYAMPGLGDFFVSRLSQRLGPEGLVRYILGRCCVDVRRVSPALLDEHVAFTARRLKEAPWGEREFLRAARSMVQLLLLRPERFFHAARSLRTPTLLIHGRHDLLVPVCASVALAERMPNVYLSILEDAGHTPQLEHPRRVFEIFDRWAQALELRRSA